ncbi:hypothetical protein FACHB389_34805 [Nostoc calcicola FACHB-389]|nr:hypothetical protein [Nostoc calcicola FACHB-3891]OKH17317.1 hypothetical protein FACHB389_34805 [Nostoc calcicola FACHB-389]
MNDINSEMTQLDPAWDYYPLWHSLHHIKARIDSVLNLMIREEDASPGADKEFRRILDLTSDKLIEIVNQFPEDDEE